MTAPRFRSRTLRRVKVKTPGGKTVTHYRKRKPAKSRCAETGEILHGVPQARPAKHKQLAKTKRRPERPYGGVLSSRATRRLIIQKTREQ